MREDIERIVLGEQQIKERLKVMGREMEADIEDSAVFIGVLRGSSVFVADLMRHITSNVKLDYLQVGRSRNEEGELDLELIKDISVDVQGETVFLLEDTVDTGGTLQFLKQLLIERGAAEVKICVLIDKTGQRKRNRAADYTGFHINDLDGQWNYVVGYGIDFNERYRNLPFVGVLKEELWTDLEL